MIGSLAVIGGAALLLALLVSRSGHAAPNPVVPPEPIHVIPIPGQGTHATTCPICHKTFTIQNGTMLQPHPPCPWPNAPGPVDPVLPFVPIIPQPVHPIEPPKPAGPDPLKPVSPATPGTFYQVVENDNPSKLVTRAYAGKLTPHIFWPKIAAHPLNAWMLGHLSSGTEAGGFFPKWNGYKSEWHSGNRWGEYYLPLPEEFTA